MPNNRGGFWYVLQRATAASQSIFIIAYRVKRITCRIGGNSAETG